MKAFISGILLALTLYSCGIKETMQKTAEMKDDIASTFQHDKVNVSIHWGTDENDNYYKIVMYEYDLQSTTYDTLELIGNQIIHHITGNYPISDNLEFIQVLFTNEQDPDEPESYVSFKQKMYGFNQTL